MRVFRKNVAGLGLDWRAVLLIMAVVIAVSCLSGCASAQYEQALGLLESGDLDGAREAFAKLEDYEDCAEYVRKIDAYRAASVHLSAGRYEDAAAAFDALRDFLDSAEQAMEAYYQIASSIFGEARIWFLDKEAVLKIDREAHERVITAEINGTYNEQREEAAIALTKAVDMLDSLESYKDSADLACGIRTLMLAAEYNEKRGLLYFEGAAEFFAEYRDRFDMLASNPEAADKAKECAALEEYFTGRDLYLAGKFEQAAEQLKGVEILDADTLYDFIRAVVMLGNGNTIDALELAVDCIDRTGFLGDEEKTQERYIGKINGEHRLFLSYYTAGMDVCAGFVGKAPLDASVSGFNFTQELLSYWEAQVDAGRNPAGIEKMPATNDWMSLVTEYAFSDLYNSRIERMEQAVTSQNLQSFYTSTDSKPSPVEITGFGIYVSLPENKSSGLIYRFGRGSHDVHYLSGLAPGLNDPFFYADKPENARYLLLFTVSHSFHARWVYVRGGGFAGNTYHTTVTATLKDCATGEILYSGSQRTKVPDDFIIYDDHYYAPAKFDYDEVLALVKDLYNNW